MDNYIELALRTEPTAEQYETIAQRLADPQVIRLLHAFVGLATETGEILDALKKYVFYGKPLDLVNLAEEIGDLNWYEAIATDALAILLEQNPNDLEKTIKETNIAKLKARYPDKFSETNAVIRDLSTERDILNEVEESKKMIRYGEEKNG
jgi:NTP pyrophosphatase (non-canonical NTP hydrolase)